jgi:glycosyltransferase involved in cell wall biosynthesis
VGIVNPLVSIVIPTYGRPKLLLRAINSVINQSYDNKEIIVVDDNDPNSQYSEETRKLLRELIDQKQIIYTKMPQNSGGALARNKGAEISKGELLCFLDDDDEFLPDKLKLQVSKFIESKFTLAVVGGFANILDENGNLKRIEHNEIKGNVFKYQLSSNICTTSIAMINKGIFMKVDGFSNVPSSQEHTLFIKIFSENPYYDYINKPVVNIYHHSGIRISTGNRKAEGAIRLHHYVQTLYGELTKTEQAYINNSHYTNIIRAYMGSKANRLASYKYFIKLIKNKKKVDNQVLKSFIIIILGLKQLDRIKKILTSKVN